MEGKFISVLVAVQILLWSFSPEWFNAEGSSAPRKVNQTPQCIEKPSVYSLKLKGTPIVESMKVLPSCHERAVVLIGFITREKESASGYRRELRIRFGLFPDESIDDKVGFLGGKLLRIKNVIDFDVAELPHPSGWIVSYVKSKEGGGKVLKLAVLVPDLKSEIVKAKIVKIADSKAIFSPHVFVVNGAIVIVWGEDSGQSSGIGKYEIKFAVVDYTDGYLQLRKVFVAVDSFVESFYATCKGKFCYILWNSEVEGEEGGVKLYLKEVAPGGEPGWCLNLTDEFSINFLRLTGVYKPLGNSISFKGYEKRFGRWRPVKITLTPGRDGGLEAKVKRWKKPSLSLGSEFVYGDEFVMWREKFGAGCLRIFSGRMKYEMGCVDGPVAFSASACSATVYGGWYELFKVKGYLNYFRINMIDENGDTIPDEVHRCGDGGDKLDEEGESSASGMHGKERAK